MSRTYGSVAVGMHCVMCGVGVRQPSPRSLWGMCCVQEQGYTPLHVAAARNYYNCVKVSEISLRASSAKNVRIDARNPLAQVLLNMSMDVDVNAVTTKLYTPLYLAIACNADLSAEMLREAGGKESIIEPPEGYRNILDINVTSAASIPSVPRAADDVARNLGRPAYFGQL